MWISAICYTLEGKYICTNKSDRFLVCTWPKLLQSDYQPIHSDQVLAKLNLCIHIPLALIWQADALALNWENWFHISKFSITFGCLWIHFMMSEFQFTKSESKKIIFLPCFVLPCLPSLTHTQFWKVLFHYENLDRNGSFEKNVKNKSYIIKGSCLLFVCESNLPSYPDISDIRKWFTFDTREKCV